MIEERAVALVLNGQDDAATEALESTDGPTDDRGTPAFSAIYNLLRQFPSPIPEVEAFLRHVSPTDGRSDSPALDPTTV